MTDRKKVIRGLEKLKANEGCISVYDNDCDTCPYDGKDGCCGAVVSDAIALLKAQEPRVMTLEEINAVKQNDVLVYESNAAFKAIFHFIVAEGVVDNELRIKTEFERIDMAAPFETYNRVWRCWTSRPTDEQREAIPWND